MENKKTRIISAADRAARSARMMGNTLRKTHPHTPETKAKIATSSKGKKHTAEHVEHRSEAIIGLGETNGASVHYSFRSPDGVLYTGRNISHFVRNNSHLFSAYHLQHSPSSKHRVSRATVRLTRLNLGLNKSWFGWTKVKESK